MVFFGNIFGYSDAFIVIIFLILKQKANLSRIGITYFSKCVTDLLQLFVSYILLDHLSEHLLVHKFICSFLSVNIVNYVFNSILDQLFLRLLVFLSQRNRSRVVKLFELLVNFVGFFLWVFFSCRRLLYLFTAFQFLD